MKIYPSKHKIKQVLESNIDKDISIPLAHLDVNHEKYNISKIISQDFSTSTKKALIPNMELYNENSLIFNEYGTIIDSNSVINRVDDKYYYYPNNMIEFTPLQFNYEMIIKKRLSYNISSKYNLNISCIDDKNKLSFTNRLSKVLVAPSQRNYLPNNITINNNSTNINSLINIDYENTDFVFIESNDGLYYDHLINNKKELIDFNSFLDSNINTWVIGDEHDKYPICNIENDLIVSIKKPVITSNDKIEIRDYYNASDPALSGLTVHNIFSNNICPILIIENKGRGFSIYSSSSIFSEDKIMQYRNLIYETLMYVYCNSYKKSSTVSEYISYEMPDYEVINNNLYKKTSFTSKTNLNDLLRLNTNDYNIYSINITDNNNDLPVPDDDLVNTVDNIIFKGISNNRAVFELSNKTKNTSVYQEPNKPTGWKSIYHNNKIYYIEQIHYLIESDIEQNLFLIEKDLDLLVRLYPFKSSKYGLNIEKDLQVTIPFIKTTINNIERIRNEIYVLYIDLNTKNLGADFESDFNKESEENKNKIVLANIIVQQQKENTSLTDMRLKGGGLPEDMPDNFNLLDIGHIYGRPYRQANTLVITLPKKYEIYKDKIQEVINKYKVAEDYSAIYFEDIED